MALRSDPPLNDAAAAPWHFPDQNATALPPTATPSPGSRSAHTRPHALPSPQPPDRSRSNAALLSLFDYAAHTRDSPISTLQVCHEMSTPAAGRRCNFRTSASRPVRNRSVETSRLDNARPLSSCIVHMARSPPSTSTPTCLVPSAWCYLAPGLTTPSISDQPAYAKCETAKACAFSASKETKHKFSQAATEQMTWKPASTETPES